MPPTTIDEYIEGLGDWRAEVVRELRKIVDAEAPDGRSSIKWAQPVWESGGGPFAYVKAFPRSVNIGFWRGAQLDDPAGVLEGGGDRMKHHAIRSPDGIPAEALRQLVRQAVALNAELGNPTKRKA
jgi:hypothetical protein